MIDLGIRARQARRFLGRARMKVLRRLGLWGEDWATALPKELRFWREALEERRLHLTEWKHCLDPELELQQELRGLIPAPPGSSVRILDVGSGPFTQLGKRWPGRTVEIVPVDPLADHYNEILNRLSIRPLVPAMFAEGEKLLDHFPADSFDLAYARNSLDHSYDPLAAMRSMLAVVKPLHYVYLWHVANEGVRERYTGLHQWNLDIRHGEFVIDNGRRKESVNAAFGGRAEISCEFQESGNDKLVVAKLRKLKAG